MGKKSSINEEKREIPAFLQNLLQIDVYMTDKFCAVAEKILPPRSYYSKYKALEISCHGIPWFAGWLALIWLWNSPSWHQMQINFYMGLLLDIVVVAIVKSLTRRRRPSRNSNDMFATVSVDKFSFPSGHATRACYIAHFFAVTYPLAVFLSTPILVWAAAVCVSRVLLRRHHVLDVVAGAAIGILQSLAVSYLWLSKESCVWLLSLITDEKLEGADYHV